MSLAKKRALVEAIANLAVQAWHRKMIINLERGVSLAKEFLPAKYEQSTHYRYSRILAMIILQWR